MLIDYFVFWVLLIAVIAGLSLRSTRPRSHPTTANSRRDGAWASAPSTAGSDGGNTSIATPQPFSSS